VINPNKQVKVELANRNQDYWVWIGSELVSIWEYDILAKILKARFRKSEATYFYSCMKNIDLIQIQAIL
jgi:hypothetical protein